MAKTSRPAKRRTFYLNGVTASSLLILLAVVALVATPPSPPAIAEFSPQAEQQIEEAPAEQSADAGQSVAGSRETIVIKEQAAAGEAAAPTQDTIILEGVPSALACVVWPDDSVTQSFDPQSPPCIATWPEREQGNGGATSMGVTGSEVLVVANAYVTEDSVRAYEQHFNSSYQFYGRKLRIVQVAQSADGPEGHQSYAEEIAELKPFAALQIIGGGGSSGGPETFPAYRRKLVEAGVISLTDTSTNLDSDELKESAPYAWSYGLPVDALERNFAQFVCGSLADRDAEYAGPGVSTLPRKFAVVVAQSNDAVTRDIAPLMDGLATCGLTPEVIEYNPNGDQTVAIMADLQARQFTSLLMIDSGNEQRRARASAQQVGYQPEWVQLGTIGQFEDGYWSGRGQGTWGTNETFGMAPTNKRLRIAAEPSRQAMDQGGGADLPWYDRSALPLYHQLLMLASGMQMAGPNLTPTTFEAALQSTRFPNPGAASAPFWQATVGFSGDHSFVNDVGLFWFSQTTSNERTGEGGGGYCYVDQGVRFQPGTWRQDIALFDRLCS